MGLGNALHEQKQLPKAIAAYQKAIDLDPKDARPWNNLGVVLRDQKQLPEAIAAYQKAIDLDPKYALPWYGLGAVLLHRKQLPEAIAAHQKAIDLDPTNPKYHGALGQTLLRHGEFAAARQATQTSLKLLPPNHPLRRLGQQQLQQCDRLLAQDQRRAAIRAGQAQARDADEALQLAHFCREYKRHHAAAANFYADAFAHKPELIGPLRYTAACCAALAGTGRGEDAAPLTDQARAKLRQQALDWLQADLSSLRRLVTTSPEKQPVSPLQKLAGQGSNTRAVEILGALNRLADWQRAPDLAGVRDDKELARLPAEEQKAWRALWAEVAALHKQASAHFLETQHPGRLTDQQHDKMHDVQLQAGKNYVFDLESKEFDAFLRLEDDKGNKLAQNDDIEPGVDKNSRIIFTPQESGSYCLVATALHGQGTGAFVLRIREFADPAGPVPKGKETK
jgi:tetratricopeptide (TPR) repeat protein